MIKIKPLILLALFSYSLFAEAGDVKLSCELTYKKSFLSVPDEVGRERVTVTISDSRIYRSITIDGMNIVGVVSSNAVNGMSGEAFGSANSFTDLSTSNGWDITTSTTPRVTKFKQTTNISIDRNTGNLNFYQDYEESNYRSITKASGTCSKVDTSKKVF